MKYRPGISEHDFDFKTRHAREFLAEGNKVKVTMMYRGRQMAHPELGREVLVRVATALDDGPFVGGIFLGAIGSPAVKVYFDLGNQVVNGFPEQWLRILGKRVGRIGSAGPRAEACRPATAAGAAHYAHRSSQVPDVEVIARRRRVRFRSSPAPAISLPARSPS